MQNILDAIYSCCHLSIHTHRIFDSFWKLYWQSYEANVLSLINNTAWGTFANVNCWVTYTNYSRNIYYCSKHHSSKAPLISRECFEGHKYIISCHQCALVIMINHTVQYNIAYPCGKKIRMSITSLILYIVCQYVIIHMITVAVKFFSYSHTNEFR